MVFIVLDTAPRGPMWGVAERRSRREDPARETARNVSRGEAARTGRFSALSRGSGRNFEGAKAQPGTGLHLEIAPAVAAGLLAVVASAPGTNAPGSGRAGGRTAPDPEDAG